MNALATGAHAARLTIEYVPIGCLKSDPRNPRTHSNRQLELLAESIRSFGFGAPLLIDGEDRIIAGHARIEAARRLAMSEVPAVRLAHLTKAQIRALQIADNRLCELGQWNEAILAETLKDLSLEPLDFQLTATGFELPEIDFKIQGLSIVETEASDPDDDPVVSGPAITRLGDQWVLGGHRLLCGDALSEASYAALLAEDLVSAVFTDPPYNVSVNGHVGGRGKIKHREFAMASGEMAPEAFQSFLDTALARIAAVSKPGALVYACMDWRHITALILSGERAIGELKNLCVWAKTTAGQGALYRSQHELVAIFKRSGGRHTNNVQLGRFGRNRSNLWSYPSPSRFGAAGEEGSLLSEHPTPKPVGMIADALMDCTDRGDLVLDPFMGGGATLIAAERTGRCCRGVELDPLYVDTAVRRWMRLTDQDAVRLEDGISFRSLEMAEAGCER